MSKSKTVNDLFVKKFDLKSTENIELPTEIYSSCTWTVPSLQLQKEQLNNTKSLLNDFNLEEWSRHTKHRDASSYIIQSIKKQFQVELVTQAWCKFYECLTNYALVPREAVTNKFLSSLHLCEAPGAFVTSLNHYLGNNELDLEWQWCANSLNPDYEGNSLEEMISDDRLMRHTYQNWYFGKDQTGDITKYYNHVDLVAKLQHQVWLVTADGSVDCSFDPGNQELHVSFLHYCETLTALAVLKSGGNFVLKIFTMFEHSTVCLLFLLNTLFEKVSLFKPATSKSGNSEVYVICQNYRGVHVLAPVWERLVVPYKNGQFNAGKSMFDLSDLPKDFLNRVIQASQYFMQKQVDKITENVYYFKRQTSQNEVRHLHQLKISVANRFIRKCNLKAILPTQKLVKTLDVSPFLHPIIRQLTFTNGSAKFSVASLLGGKIAADVIDIKLGERITKVRSSRFCSPENLAKFTLNRTYKPKRDLYQTVEKILAKNATIITSDDCTFNTYYEFQKYIFYKVFYSQHRNFVIVRLPLLTNFLAGLLFLVLSRYEVVHLHKNGFIVLYDRNRVSDVLERVDDVYRNLGECHLFARDVLQLVSPNLLYDNDFFDFVWNYNRIILSKM